MPYKSIEKQKANKRQYYLKNKERLLAARRKYRAENREKVLQCQKECYRKHASAVKEYQKEYYAENHEYVDARNKAYYTTHRDEIESWQRSHRVRNLKRVLVSSAKRRAAKFGIPFNISPDDFEIPTYCPVFGFKLEVGHKGFNASSPSLDRKIPKLGYVKGNIQVISYRANELKRDASLDELKKLVAFLQEE